MNDRQLKYFRHKLLAWKDEILRESRETLSHLQTETENHPDLTDRASSETDRALELRTRDRQRKLISKIDEALRRIDDGSYGWCEETGSRSAWPAWKPARSRRSASRLRNGTNVGSGSTATTEKEPRRALRRGFSRQPVWPVPA